MATEELVKAVIRAAPPPPPFLSYEGKVPFAVHAAFAAAGYVLHSTDEVVKGQSYMYVYTHPEKGTEKVIMEAYGFWGLMIIEVVKEDSSKHYFLKLLTGKYAKVGETTYASHFQNLGDLVEKVNEEILKKLDAAPAAVSPNQPSSSATRVIVVSDDDDSPRSKRCKHDIPYLSRNSGSRLGFTDPDDHNARNKGIFAPSCSGYVVPPNPIYGSGSGDLLPGPGAGMYPSRGNGGSGGMLIDPNDRMLSGSSTSGDSSDAPPGARFDPYGSPEVPGYEPDYSDRDSSSPSGGMYPDEAPFHKGSFF